MPSVTGTSSSKTSGSPVSSLSWSHTSDGNPIYLMFALAGTTPLSEVVTFNGVAADLMIDRRVINNAPFATYVWVNPGSVTANIVITPNIDTQVTAVARNVSGVDLDRLFSGFNHATGTGTAPTVNITSATGDLVLDFIGSDGNNQGFTQGAGQTETHEQQENNTHFKSASSYEAGAATVTMSWTLTVSDFWREYGFSIPADGTVAANTMRVSHVGIEVLRGGQITTSGSPWLHYRQQTVN